MGLVVELLVNLPEIVVGISAFSASGRDKIKVTKFPSLLYLYPIFCGNAPLLPAKGFYIIDLLWQGNFPAKTIFVAGVRVQNTKAITDMIQKFSYVSALINDVLV